MHESPHTTEPESLAGSPIPHERRLGTGANGLARLKEETRGLVDDVKEWVELRSELAKLQATEQAVDIIHVAVGAVLGLLIFLFALITLAIGVGWWLGHLFWGFLSVTLFMTVCVLLGFVFRERLARTLRPTIRGFLDEVTSIVEPNSSESDQPANE